jgi:hypothetical protein
MPRPAFPFAMSELRVQRAITVPAAEVVISACFWVGAPRVVEVLEETAVVCLKVSACALPW